MGTLSAFLHRQAISRADFDARLRGMAFDSAAMGPKGKTDPRNPR